jgi:hypothetical protein
MFSTGDENLIFGLETNELLMVPFSIDRPSAEE